MTTTTANAITAAIKEKVASVSTPKLVQMIREIGGSSAVDTDTMLVRVALIELYEERAGEDAADALMIDLGMMK